MLTIFSIPKPFIDHNGMIQRNALSSWKMLQPACEIILCGDDPGVKEAAIEFGVRHLPDIAKNEFGTPLLNSAFEKVVKIARFPILCYVNADIILFDDLIEAIKRIPFRPFMAVGQRMNLTITKSWDFGNTSSRSQFLEFTTKNGQLETVLAIDYFVFTPNGHLEKLLAFTVGRPLWDSWFVFHARKLEVPVIDITRVCRVIHQNHDYKHVPQGNNSYQGPEADHNYELLIDSVGIAHSCTINDATHILTRKFLLPSLSLRYWHARWKTAKAFHPFLRHITIPRWVKNCSRRIGKQ